MSGSLATFNSPEAVMKHKRGLLAGPKISGRHSTVIAAARPFVLAAKLMPEVTRVVIGPITKRATTGPARLIFGRVPAGLKAKVIGGRSAQQFYVYTKTPDATGAAIREEIECPQHTRESQKG